MVILLFVLIVSAFATTSSTYQANTLEGTVGEIRVSSNGIGGGDIFITNGSDTQWRVYASGAHQYNSSYAVISNEQSEEHKNRLLSTLYLAKSQGLTVKCYGYYNPSNYGYFKIDYIIVK